LMAAVIWRSLRWLPSFRIAIKSLAAAAAMMGLLWLMPGWNLALMVAVAAGVYFLLLFWLRGFSRNDIVGLIGREE